MKPLPERILCLVTDVERAGSEAALIRCVDDAVRGGVNMVQVRAHHLESGQKASLASQIVKAVAGRALVVVNGPADIALEVDADGVHLPESAQMVDTGSGADLLVGRSVHSVRAAMLAAESGADYVIAGTIFPSASHPGGAIGGVELIAETTSSVAIPTIAIGGIDAGNAASVVAAGASGAAVIGAIIGSEHPELAARELATDLGIENGESNSR